MAALGMNDESSIPVRDPPRSEGTGEEPSTKALHTFMLALISLLGQFLSLMQQAGMASLFDTNHQIFVMLIVALTVYGGTLIGSTYILDTPLEKFVNTLSLSFGALTIILELMILVPYLGSAALLVWLFWVVSFVAVYLYRKVKERFKSAELFDSAVGGIVEAYQNLIDYLKKKISPNEEKSGAT